MGKTRKTRACEFRPLKDSATGQSLNVYTLYGKETAVPVSMPNTIVLKGKHYQIRYHTKIFASRRVSDRLAGVIVFAHQTIILEPELGLPRMKHTLYHECAHAYFRELQESDSRLNRITNSQEEAICDLLGSAVQDLVTNNPSLK